ncbi:MAG TPA: peptide ABC transporter substrate-binding protein, partial [Dehalococcoidia bacterium]|nr:peptide ABC transporter substrate-binding protein [Dehalococcoidia bacterium]
MNRAVLSLVGAAAALVIVIAVIAVLLVTQGGGGDNTSGGERAQPTEQASSGGEDREDSGGKKVLRIPGSDPITLDPAVAQDVESATYIVEIFGGLVTLDENLNVVADLAEEVPTKENGGISPDGTVYTFHIRQDAFFHDRRPVTAEDVKYSWERALDPSTASVVAEFYLGDIVGARDKARGRAEEVSGIEVVDDRTLRVTIDAPKPYFLQKLTYPTAFVVDRREIESNPRNWTLKPNGTGPFKLKEWRLGERIVLEANKDYHLGAPKIDEVQFLLAGGGLSAYEAGEVDISGVPLDDTERIQDPSEPLNAEYHTADDLSIFYIGFNTERPPFDDVKVRQAFAMSIDREKINEVVLFNRARVA